jgi:hypothetical protein
MPDLKQECTAAVDGLMSQYGWQLLPREEYLRRTVIYFRAGVASDTRRAATYTSAMHCTRRVQARWTPACKCHAAVLTTYTPPERGTLHRMVI